MDYFSTAVRKHPKLSVVIAITVTLIVGPLTYAAVQRYQAAAAAKRSLQIGIQRNQAELQRISGMIDENHQEQAWIAADALNDGTSLISGGLLKTEPEDKLESTLQVLKQLTDTISKSRDFASGAGDFKGNDGWIKISDSLKELLDLISHNPELEAVGAANTTTDLAVKSAQWSALQVENGGLEKVRANLERAQALLLAKDPATQARIQKALDEATQTASERQDVQSKFLRDYYKDRPEDIRLSISSGTLRYKSAAFQIASGIHIVDPSEELWKLGEIDGINPDFIYAIACEIAGEQNIASGGDGMVGRLCPRCQAGDPCDRYPNGAYINAFGPPAYGSAKPDPMVQLSSLLPKRAVTVGGGGGNSPDMSGVQKQKTSDDLFGKYDPTHYFTKNLASNGKTGFVIRGTGGQLLTQGTNHPVAQENLDENYGEVFSAPPGTYDVLPFSSNVRKLPGFVSHPVTIIDGMVTIINVPVGYLHFKWTVDKSDIALPMLLSANSNAVLESVAYYGSQFGGKEQDQGGLTASPGSYRVAMSKIFSSTLDPRYPNIISVSVIGGKTTELTMIPNQGSTTNR